MSSYHGWTHARKEDGGTDPIPFPPSSTIIPWARLGLGGNTVTSGTWANAECNDAMSFNEVAAGFAVGDIFTLDSSLGYYRIICEMDGLYLVNMIVTWTDTFAEFRAIDMQQALGDHLYGEGYGLTDTRGPFPSTGADYFNVDKLTGFIFKSSSVNAPDPTLNPRAYQASGVGRAFDLQSLRVMYLGQIGAEADWIFNP